MTDAFDTVDDFDLIIPSETAAGQAVQERILARLEELRFSEKDLFGVRLALEEALVNAIKHGNRMDASKSISISCQIATDRIRVVIEDEGKGFDPCDVPDPTADENLERPCGRGIMLMRAFMTMIEYNERGNRVTLEKRRAVAEPDINAPSERAS